MESNKKLVDLINKRAEKLHGSAGVNAHNNYSHEELNGIWKRTVRSKEDAERFFLVYHPELPEAMAKAYADYFHRAVTG